MELRIDPEFESRIPPLTDDEFAQLEENILADGAIISPIIVWDGVIIDGHNRFRIVEKYPHISFTTCERTFSDRHEALAWICKNQLGRRNLTFQQKKYLIGRQYESEKISDAFHGNQHIKVQSGSGQNVHHHKTAERIAEENDINEKTVRRAAQYSRAVDLAEELEPGIRKEILSGAIKATDKEITAFASADPNDRPALIEELRKPPNLRKKVLPERHLLSTEEIASDKPADISKETPEDMLSELEDALNSFKFRWSVCLSHNSDYFSKKEYRKKVNPLIKDGLTYLNQILKGEIPL